MRSKKHLSIAIAAALALTAMVNVASASAEGSPIGFFLSSGEFEAESYPVRIAADDAGNTAFKPAEKGAYTTTCEHGYYGTVGNVTGPSTSIGPLEFEYVGCKSGAKSVTIDWNGCTWTFNVVFLTAGTADLDCPAGKAVEMKTYTQQSKLVCTETIGPQQDLAGVSFSNSGSGSNRSVTTTVYINSLENTTVGGLLNCGVYPGTNTDGIFQGYFDLEDYWHFANP